MLFLGAGHIFHSTGQRNLNKLGGLIHAMPWLAGLLLIGIFAGAGVPPLNGFVSEWLLLQAFLFFPSLPSSYLIMLVPIGAALLILAAALAGYVMVKLYGIAFLGRARHLMPHKPHDLNRVEKCALTWYALQCILLGILPVLALRGLIHIPLLLLGSHLDLSSFINHPLFLAPISQDRASYSPLLLFAAIIFAVGASCLIIYFLFHGAMRRADAWDCGYPLQTPRMQDSAEGFAQPVKHIFTSFFKTERHLPRPEDHKPHYDIKLEDRFWYGLYLPLANTVKQWVSWVGKLQQGRIGIYLLYSFLTLIVLLLTI
jgi:NADH:ubiquinone oxidoreductase subunit 5 (subunit L)/multisubunit Na+/H+ antiporter MnhA subunit